MNRIKEFLEEQGIRKTDLAHRLDKSFNMYVTSKVQLPISVLYKIADILQVDMRNLLISNINKERIYGR